MSKESLCPNCHCTTKPMTGACQSCGKVKMTWKPKEEKKHLLFNEGFPQTGKTKWFAAISNYDGTELGEVKWCGAWRQCVFKPFGDTMLSWDCLRELSNFIHNLMEERRNPK